MFAGLTLLLLQDALFLLGYLARGTAFPKPLGREEEARMIERMQAGDGEARASLIEHNLRLAAHIARKYTVPGYDADDLISIGTVGLIKGVNTYKPESGTQLSTIVRGALKTRSSCVCAQARSAGAMCPCRSRLALTERETKSRSSTY